MVKYLKELNEAEKERFENSELKKIISRDFYFLSPSLEYDLEYFGEGYTDHSLVVFQKEKPVVAFYAFSSNQQLKFFHWPITIHQSDDDSDVLNAAYKELFARMNEMHKSGAIEKIFFYHNHYFASEFLDRTVSLKPQHHAIVDLSLSIENIRMNIRRRYKSFINWGEKNLTTVILDASNPDAEKFYAFKKFHLQVSGRQTRNDRTWDIQMEMIRENSTYLTLCYLGDRLVSGAMSPHGNEVAFYGVGVNDRDLMAENMPIGHYPIYTSIIHAKKIGLKKYHLNKIELNRSDNKLNNIAKFKEGFTGTLHPVTVYEANFTNAAEN